MRQDGWTGKRLQSRTSHGGVPGENAGENPGENAGENAGNAGDFVNLHRRYCEKQAQALRLRAERVLSVPARTVARYPHATGSPAGTPRYRRSAYGLGQIGEPA